MKSWWVHLYSFFSYTDVDQTTDSGNYEEERSLGETARLLSQPDAMGPRNLTTISNAAQHLQQTLGNEGVKKLIHSSRDTDRLLRLMTDWFVSSCTDIVRSDFLTIIFATAYEKATVNGPQKVSAAAYPILLEGPGERAKTACTLAFCAA